MKQLVDIDYMQDGSSYKITLMARSLDALYELAKIPELTEKAGEDLANALMGVSNGGFEYVVRYKDGVINSGPNGQPGSEEFYADGSTRQRKSYKDGKLNDSAGVPALQAYHENGRRHLIGYFKDDISTQGPHGEFAWQEMNKEGVVTRLARAGDNGQLVDLTAEEVDEFRNRYLTAKKVGEIQKTFGGKLKLRAP